MLTDQTATLLLFLVQEGSFPKKRLSPQGVRRLREKGLAQESPDGSIRPTRAGENYRLPRAQVLRVWDVITSTGGRKSRAAVRN